MAQQLVLYWDIFVEYRMFSRRRRIMRERKEPVTFWVSLWV